MRSLSVFVGLTLAALGCAPRVDDCWNGLALGEHIELRIVDVYAAGGPYTGSPELDPGWGSCAARDGLDVGSRVELELVGTSAVSGCREYSARPLSGITPTDGIDFTGPIGGAGAGLVLATEVGACGGFYQLLGYRLPEQGPSPLGERAMPGHYPPVILQRSITGTCHPSCIDFWVGEVDLISTPDAGAIDAGM